MYKLNLKRFYTEFSTIISSSQNQIWILYMMSPYHNKRYLTCEFIFIISYLRENPCETFEQSCIIVYFTIIFRLFKIIICMLVIIIIIINGVVI